MRSGGIGKPELSAKRVAYVQYTGPRKGVHESRVRVRTLRGGKDLIIYRARVRAPNSSILTDLSVSEDQRFFAWGRADQGIASNNVLARYSVASGRLAYAPGSQRIASTAWAGGRFGMAIAEHLADAACRPDDTPETDPSACRVSLTGPLPWSTRP